MPGTGDQPRLWSGAGQDGSFAWLLNIERVPAGSPSNLAPLSSGRLGMWPSVPFFASGRGRRLQGQADHVCLVAQVELERQVCRCEPDR